jgi:hypothetical protein
MLLISTLKETKDCGYKVGGKWAAIDVLYFYFFILDIPGSEQASQSVLLLHVLDTRGPEYIGSGTHEVPWHDLRRRKGDRSRWREINPIPSKGEREGGLRSVTM